MLCRIACIIAITSAIAAPLGAQTRPAPPDTMPEPAVTLAEVQVTATPVARIPLAVAQSTATVSARALERTLGATLAATIGHLPGVAVRQQGPAAAAPVVRGLSGDRVLVLQDGQRTGDLASTAPDHGVTIDPIVARRVEVVRGPAALLYGNNAIGGVVNVISDDIPMSVPARRFGSATTAIESGAPGGGAQLETTAPVGERGAVRARFGLRAHDDLRVGRDGGPGGGPARLANTDFRNVNGVLGGAWHGDRGFAGAAYRGYRFDYGLPFPADEDDGAVTLHGRRDEVLLRGERAIGGWVEQLRAEGAAQWYHHDEVLSDGVVGTRLELRTQNAQLLARTRPVGPFADGAIGVSGLLRQNGVSGEQALTPPNDASSAGAFIFQELLIGPPRDTARPDERLRLPVGLRVDRHVVRSLDSDQFGPGRERVFGGISGSVGLTIPVAPGASLAGSVARALRSPTSEELFSLAGHAGTGAFEIGDPNLHTEINTGLDLVLRVERRGTSALFGGYDNRLDGFIGLYPAGRDTVVSDGVGGTKSLPLYVVSQRAARMRGLEASVERALTRRVVAGAFGDVVHARDTDGDPLPFIPGARIGASTRFDDGFRSAGITVRHAAAQGRVPDGELRADDYTLLDLHGSLRLLRGAHAHVIALRVENALNTLYRDASSRVKDFAPAQGRNVVLLYRVNF